MNEIKTIDELLDRVVAGDITHEEAVQFVRDHEWGAFIASYTTYGIQNTIDHNETLWAIQREVKQPKPELLQESYIDPHWSGKPGPADDEDAV